jgi:hypothetical protein
VVSIYLMRSLDFSVLTNPSSRTVALDLTQLLAEMRTRNLAGGIQQPARKADNLRAVCELIV